MAKEETNIEIEETVAPEGETESSEGPAPDGVSLNELQLLANIVDLATQRGAFRGNELSQVGAVYDRLTAFLGFVAKQQEEAKAQQESDEAEETAQGE